MFSPQEQELINSDVFFIHKRNITEKIYAELHSLRTPIQQLLIEQIPSLPNELIVAGKINRGENLDGLPWINMDCPGWFKHENVFAIRYLFWWAKHFSITLHVGGVFLSLLNTEKLLQLADNSPAYWNIHPTPWKYHYGEDNYMSLEEVNELIIRENLKRGFAKISLRYDLKEMNNLSDVGIQGTKTLLKLIK